MTVLKSWTARCEGCPECDFRVAPHSAAICRDLPHLSRCSVMRQQQT